jgi:hypothetical protein
LRNSCKSIHGPARILSKPLFLLAHVDFIGPCDWELFINWTNSNQLKMRLRKHLLIVAEAEILEPKPIQSCQPTIPEPTKPPELWKRKVTSSGPPSMSLLGKHENTNTSVNTKAVLDYFRCAIKEAILVEYIIEYTTWAMLVIFMLMLYSSVDVRILNYGTIRWNASVPILAVVVIALNSRYDREIAVGGYLDHVTINHVSWRIFAMMVVGVFTIVPLIMYTVKWSVDISITCSNVKAGTYVGDLHTITSAMTSSPGICANEIYGWWMWLNMLSTCAHLCVFGITMLSMWLWMKITAIGRGIQDLECSDIHDKQKILSDLASASIFK